MKRIIINLTKTSEEEIDELKQLLKGQDWHYEDQYIG